VEGEVEEEASKVTKSGRDGYGSEAFEAVSHSGKTGNQCLSARPILLTV